MLAAMGKFNEEMCNAGVMQAGEGLHPTLKGAQPPPHRITRELPLIVN
jgi:hypothetical protein